MKKATDHLAISLWTEANLSKKSFKDLRALCTQEQVSSYKKETKSDLNKEDLIKRMLNSRNHHHSPDTCPLDPDTEAKRLQQKASGEKKATANAKSEFKKEIENEWIKNSPTKPDFLWLRKAEEEKNNEGTFHNKLVLTQLFFCFSEGWSALDETEIEKAEPVKIRNKLGAYKKAFCELEMRYAELAKAFDGHFSLLGGIEVNKTEEEPREDLIQEVVREYHDEKGHKGVTYLVIKYLRCE